MRGAPVRVRLLLVFLAGATAVLGCGGGGGGSESDDPSASGAGGPISADETASARDSAQASAAAVQSVTGLLQIGRADVDRELSSDCPKGGQATIDGDVELGAGPGARPFSYSGTAVLNECNGYSGTLRVVGEGTVSGSTIQTSSIVEGSLSGECQTTTDSLLIGTSRAFGGGDSSGTVSGVILVDCDGRPFECTLTDVPVNGNGGSIECVPVT